MARNNPPYSGWREGWWRRPRPDEDRVAYETKTDALNVFLDWNRTIVEDYGGPDMVHSPESFEAINHEFNIRGDRRVDTIAKAVWWAMPSGGPPWYLEDINLGLLNQTAPVVYGPSGLAFTLPDHVELQKLIEEEEARGMSGWEARERSWPADDVGWDEDDEDPF